MTTNDRVTEGRDHPLGASCSSNGVNFAVFSAHATRIVVCLFDEGSGSETQIDLATRTGDIWHGHVEGVGEGQLYGLRAHGPYAPDQGHRFNPAKLLIDPYARELIGDVVNDEALWGGNDLDSAPFMPRCRVVTDKPAQTMRPRTALTDTVIYEANVKGLTARMPGLEAPGSFAALGSDTVIRHLTDLGVSALELLPVQAFFDDAFLVEKGLRNYWGYQTIGFFAPAPRYLSGGGLDEVRSAVDRLHRAGIEVLLDVVYNHTSEGDAGGATLCFRGLDNASYYRLADDRAHYINDTGTGNTLNFDHPMVTRMVMDSLRYWVEVIGVDGFRFDLCATLGRTAEGFRADGPFMTAVRQDPVLADVKLIAEPWDIGPGGYQLGSFPAPFLEWNDRFRDDTRRFWRGDASVASAMAERLAGSAPIFDHAGRVAHSSVNFITAHDGFTLKDLTSYSEKHNAQNGEDNRDGHNENLSDNLGVEGETEDEGVIHARLRRQRAFLATLLLSQGTPMLLGGDELGNGQNGNNNAYCQDNEISWIDWPNAEWEKVNYTAQLIALRAKYSLLRQREFLHGEPAAGGVNIQWLRADGTAMQEADWSEDLRSVLMLLRPPETSDGVDVPVCLALNAGEDLDIQLPFTSSASWHCVFCSDDRAQVSANEEGAEAKLPAQSVSLFALNEQA